MLEDMGFYCVDNLPIPLVEKFAELTLERQGAVLRMPRWGSISAARDRHVCITGCFDEWSRSRGPM